jgi:hypothetical protein
MLLLSGEEKEVDLVATEAMVVMVALEGAMEVMEAMVATEEDGAGDVKEVAGVASSQQMKPALARKK